MFSSSWCSVCPSGCKYERCPCSSVWLQWLGLTGLSSTTRRRAAVDDPATRPSDEDRRTAAAAYRVRGDAGPPFGANIVHVAARTPLSGSHQEWSPPEAAETPRHCSQKKFHDSKNSSVFIVFVFRLSVQQYAGSSLSEPIFSDEMKSLAPTSFSGASQNITTNGSCIVWMNERCVSLLNGD